jgi:predicted dehydrogenase
MNKIRFAIVGSGWRSKFYIRIAKALPDQFELCSMLFRSEEKAQVFQEEYGVNVTISEEAFIEAKPDFVVVAVNKQSIFEVSKHYLELGIPVLAETPAALTLQELNELWRMRNRKMLKLQVAEQYFLYPSYSTLIQQVASGILGEIENVTISCVHEYHAASLIRKLLGIYKEQVCIYGRSYSFFVTETDSREGAILDGRVAKKDRVRLSFDFEGNKAAFYDFSGVQYHSYIRTTHLNVQGVRGEINDFTLRYLNDKNEPQQEEMVIGYNKVLSEDETAIAKCLLGMKRYIETGEEFYPLAEALQDAYWTILMKQAVETGEKIYSQKQIWNNE